LLESRNFLCSATAATKTALGIIQLWFSRHLSIHSFWGWGGLAKRCRGSWFIYSCLPSVYGAINLLIVQHPYPLTHTSQPNHPALQDPLIHYQTFRN